MSSTARTQGEKEGINELEEKTEHKSSNLNKRNFLKKLNRAQDLQNNNRRSKYVTAIQ